MVVDALGVEISCSHGTRRGVTPTRASRYAIFSCLSWGLAENQVEESV